MVSNCSDQSPRQSHQSGPNLPLRIMVMPRSNRSDVVSVSEGNAYCRSQFKPDDVN